MTDLEAKLAALQELTTRLDDGFWNSLGMRHDQPVYMYDLRFVMTAVHDILSEMNNELEELRKQVNHE